MDRRKFLIAGSSVIMGAAATWSGLINSNRVYPHVGSEVASTIETRLAELRRLDDILGSGNLRTLASEEFRLITRLLVDTTQNATIKQRLYVSAGEAARICGWMAHDSEYHAAAQRYYMTALRASATANDPLLGANTLAFMATQAYNTGKPLEAVALLKSAHDGMKTRTTPKTRSILHARTARALSKTGDEKATRREVDAAFNALNTGPHVEEPSWCYWVNEAELHMSAGSSALDLGDAKLALTHFNSAAYEQKAYPRSSVIYLARIAEAHVALGQLDEGCHIAHQAADYLEAVASSRSYHHLDGIRTKLSAHTNVPAAREFLERTNIAG